MIAAPGAERPSAFELLVARRGEDHARAGGAREEQRESRDAAGAEREHRVTRSHAAGLDERMPGRDAGAGQGRRLLEREARRNPHGVLLSRAARTRRASRRRAARRARRTGLRAGRRSSPGRTCRPTRSPVADARDAGADRHDLARAVRERNGVALHDAAEVVAGDHRLVPVVERGGAHAHQRPGRAGLGIRPLDAAQRVDAARAAWNLLDFHRRLASRDARARLRGLADVMVADPQSDRKYRVRIPHADASRSRRAAAFPIG